MSGLRSGGLAEKVSGWMAVGVLAVGTMALPSRLMAQASTATVHGHVNNAAGMPLTAGEIKMTTERGDVKDNKFQYSFPLDANGNYKGDGIKAGDYVMLVYQGGKSVDFIDSTTLIVGQDKTVNFDMTRKEFVDKMSPEDKAALEEYKKKNAEIMAANGKIANLNTLLASARADIKSNNYDSAVKGMTDATAMKPDEALLWDTLGDAQLGQANAADKAAKASHATDASVPDKFNAAVASYQKALDLNAKAAKPSPELTATVENQLGQAYGKLPGKQKDSVAAYEAAAAADKPKAGMYYFNEAATLFNAGDGDDAAAAADKAIAADPNKADAYYIKGQSLVAKATVDEKTGKITVPPGCAEAYQKYLELVPDGPRAEEVKGILTGIGQPIKNSFKAGKGGK